MKFALLLLLCVPVWAKSVSFVPLNNPGGSFSTSWNLSVTNLYGTESSNFSLDLWALDNNGINSSFKGGGIAFYGSSFTLYANLFDVQFDPTTGVLTALFRSDFPELLPGGKGYGILTGTLHETLINGQFGNGYVTDVVSTVPEPGTWAMVILGILFIIPFTSRNAKIWR